MDRNLTNRFACTVCGLESRRHTGWFLVVENQWLDRLKILAWHPVLARQAAMRHVCSVPHLKTLLTHWLNHANLQLLAGGSNRWAPADNHDVSSEGDSVTLSVGRLMGELAVHRESLSRVWTGSPETLECILNALVGGAAEHSRVPFPLPSDPAATVLEYAAQVGSGD